MATDMTPSRETPRAGTLKLLGVPGVPFGACGKGTRGIALPKDDPTMTPCIFLSGSFWDREIDDFWFDFNEN